MTSILLNNITTVDCAVLAKGEMLGYSFSPVVRLSGDTTNEEEVVVDFSSARKILKEFFDTTVDHKTVCVGPRSTSFSCDLIDNVLILDKGYHITSKQTCLSAEGSIFLLLSEEGGLSPLDCLFEHIRNLLAEGLPRLPGVQVELVSIHNQPLVIDLPESRGAVFVPFNYTHGLAKSSSYGCQNILHGHTSLFQFTTCLLEGAEETFQQTIGGNNTTAIDRVHTFVSGVLQEWLTGAYVYNHEYRVQGGVTYTSNTRGNMKLTFPNTQKVIELPNEPTAENMLDVVVDRTNSLLAQYGLRVCFAYLSEGLWKGATRHTPYQGDTAANATK